MSDIPPFPNSVNAVQQVPKHQIQKIDPERMQGRETNAKQEIITTIYDAKVYTYKGGQLSYTTPKVTGQHILVTVGVLKSLSQSHATLNMTWMATERLQTMS